MWPTPEPLHFGEFAYLAMLDQWRADRNGESAKKQRMMNPLEDHQQPAILSDDIMHLVIAGTDMESIIESAVAAPGDPRSTSQAVAGNS